jgi:hypothetical protein
MPGTYPLTIYRGDTGQWTFVLWADEAKTVPSDLTGVTVLAEIRQTSGSPVLATLACTIQLPNTINAVLSSAASLQLKAGPAVWDLQLTYPGSVVITALAGPVTVVLDVTGSTAVSSRTIGGLITEARMLLNDEIPISGAPRYADNELTSALNDAMIQVRAKRPDAFLRYGLRVPPPLYALPADNGSLFPIEDQFYPAVIFYVVGRAELTEDTFADDGRAVTLMSKFVSQLTKVQS